MNVTINDISETRKDVVVTVDGDEVAKEEARILKEMKKQARIPGFRPGKAPDNLMRQRYGKQLKDELKNTVMRNAYNRVLEEEGLQVYSVVEFPEIDEPLAGQEQSLDLTVDVTPDFELPAYKGLTTSSPPTEVEDEEIDQTIDRIRRQRAEFVKVERAAEEGDYVKVSYVGKHGEHLVADMVADNPRLRAWGTVNDGWEEAGTEEARQFGVPAIIDALVGMQAGDRKTVAQVIPDDFSVESLRGETVSYDLEVGEVRERKLPELDEEFLKSVRAESLEDFKAQIMDELESQKKREADEARRQQILDHLAGIVEFPLPQSAVEGETQNALSRIVNQNLQQGVPQEELEKQKEQIQSSAAQTAEREVKLQIILNRIAEKEKITVENEDLSRAVYSMAIQQRQRPEDLAKELKKDRDRVLQLQRQILFGKTLDFILSQAKEDGPAAPVPEEKKES